jgi:uncharacterized lipoprotein YmbA
MRAGAAPRHALRAALLAALLSGCLGKSGPVEYFTLSDASPPPLAKLPGVRPDLGVAIGALEMPRYLDRPELVTRDGTHRLEVWNEHRWAGSLRTDILRVLADDLGTLLGTARIAVFPVEPRFPPDFRVMLELLEFEGVPGEQVTLRARWTVAGADGRALAVEQVHVSERTASGAWEGLVAAQRAALGRVTRQIAERIAALAAP